VPEIAKAEHAEQARLLAEAGADFLMIETMPLIAEAEAAVQAAIDTGLETAVGFVLGADGRLLSGESLEEAFTRLNRFPIAAFFVNCTPPAVITRALQVLRDLTDLPLGGYANLGEVDETVGWTADETVNGDRYAPFALDWVEAGAQIVGGCCGTRPEHIAALRRSLDAIP
jgi:S-methylmethionine-dependent homocysteine/selenocysteine methylase